MSFQYKLLEEMQHASVVLVNTTLPGDAFGKTLGEIIRRETLLNAFVIALRNNGIWARRRPPIVEYDLFQGSQYNVLNHTSMSDTCKSRSAREETSTW